MSGESLQRAKWRLAVALALLGAAIHLPRLDEFPLRGEESRRGLVAVEMTRSGDFLVPREQGRVFESRPPLQNWAIAAAGRLRGQIDEAAVRLPSVAATVAVALVVYWYSLGFMSAVGAFAAGAAYLSMAQVLELGRLGETEAVFTALLASGLMVWRRLHRDGQPTYVGWITAYILMALAMLTKGPQAPVYFCGGIVLYLLISRRWRQAVTIEHAAGILAAAIVVAAWFVPCCERVGFDATLRVLGQDSADRFEDFQASRLAAHVLSYPPAVVFGSLAPWSLLLVVFAYRSFRSRLGDARDDVVFLASCVACAFPTCWFVPEARPRYLMPVFPLIAPLIGLVIDRTLAANAEHARTAIWTRHWRHYAIFFAIVSAATAPVLGAVVAAGVLPSAGRWAAAWSAALVAIGLVLAACMHRARSAATAAPMAIGVAAVALWLAVVHQTVVVGYIARTANDIPAQMAELRQRLPREAKLVSVGPIDHLFAFYYGRPIERIDARGWWPRLPRDVEFICISPSFSRVGVGRLGEAWSAVCVVSCERRHKEDPSRVVVVARRSPASFPTSGAGLRRAARHVSGDLAAWK